MSVVLVSDWIRLCGESVGFGGSYQRDAGC